VQRSPAHVPRTARTASSHGEDPVRRQGVYPALYLLVECDRPSAGSLHVSLRGIARVEVGRGERRVLDLGEPSGLRLTVPDPWMSVAHAELACTLGEWTIRDAGSRNGVVKNGERVTHAALADGDVLEIGHCFFVFVAQEPEPSTDPLPALGELQTYHPALMREYAALAKLAPSRVCVMLFGETGTGKAVLARAIHAASGRGGRSRSHHRRVRSRCRSYIRHGVGTQRPRVDLQTRSELAFRHRKGDPTPDRDPQDRRGDDSRCRYARDGPRHALRMVRAPDSGDRQRQQRR
jgi:hypothetical protein